MDKSHDAEFCKLVVEKGIATQAQVDECLEIVRKASDLGASVNLVDTMVSKGIVGRSEADELLATLRKQRKTLLGGYELLEKIGQGGMGIVYKAKQLSMNRLVAIKVVRRALSQDRVFVERFIREAHSAARLSHTNIIHAIDAGQADGYHYFVMEYVEGVTVAERIRKQPFSEQDALKVARDMAEALVHAQRHSIVHRDIKPENIMLSRDGTAKLADLGLAKTSDMDSSVTMVGKSIGTPHYMSPEQARGEAGLDTRSDIYSLGATLFHMLTNKAPFQGDTPAVVIAKRLSEPVPSARTLKPEISIWTDRMVARMMAKNADDRYQTAEELLSAIEALMRGEPLPSHAAAGSALRMSKSRGASSGAYPASAPVAGGRSQARHQAQADVAEPAANSNTIFFIGGAVATVVIIIAAFFLFKADPQQVANERAAAAYVKVIAYVEANQNEAGIERLANFISEHRGTDKASEAAARMHSLKALLAGRAAFAELKALCDALVTEHKYGEAISSINQFLQSGAPAGYQDEASEMRRNIAARANDDSSAIVREAQAALAAGEYAEAVRKLRAIAAFGFEPTTKIMNEQIAEVKRRENAANNAVIWQRIKRDTAALIEKEDFDAALKLMEQARNLPAADFAKEIDAVHKAIAAGQQAVEAREIARTEAKALYDKLFVEDVRPLFAQRNYIQAAEALTALAQREDLALVVDEVEPARKDLARLKSLFQEVELFMARYSAGRMVNIDGEVLEFTRFDDGRVWVKSGAAELGKPLKRIKVLDIGRLMGANFPNTQEQSLQYAAFLLYDDRGDINAARALLAKLPRDEDVIRYIILAGHNMEALEKAAEDAFAEIERIAEKTPAGVPNALANFKTNFGGTRTYNEKLFEIKRLRDGDDESTTTVHIPGMPDDIRQVLLGYWSLDSWRDRITFDLSGRGNHATVAPRVRMAQGIKGGAADTSFGPIIVPWRPSFNPKGSFSVEFCIKANSSASASLMAMGNDGSSVDGSFSISLNSGYIYFDLYPRALLTRMSEMIRIGQWYHITAVLDAEAGLASVYVNGRRTMVYQTRANMDNTRNQFNLTIGGMRRRRFDGLMDEVRFWSIPLNERQVAALANHMGVGPGVSQEQIEQQRKEAIRKIQVQMNSKAAIDYIHCPLPYAIVGILNQVDVPYQWETSALSVGDLMHETVSVEKEGTAAQVLQDLLRPLRLEYTITESGVVVNPEEGYLPPGAVKQERVLTVEERLQNTVSLQAPYKLYGGATSTAMIQVQHAVLEVLQQVDVELDIDTSLQVAPAEMQRLVRPSFQNMRCTDALDLILRPVGLTYRLIEDKVVMLRR